MPSLILCWRRPRRNSPIRIASTVRPVSADISSRVISVIGFVFICFQKIRDVLPVPLDKSRSRPSGTGETLIELHLFRALVQPFLFYRRKIVRSNVSRNRST